MPPPPLGASSVAARRRRELGLCPYGPEGPTPLALSGLDFAGRTGEIVAASASPIVCRHRPSAPVPSLRDGDANWGFAPTALKGLPPWLCRGSISPEEPAKSWRHQLRRFYAATAPRRQFRRCATATRIGALPLRP